MLLVRMPVRAHGALRYFASFASLSTVGFLLPYPVWAWIYRYVADGGTLDSGLGAGLLWMTGEMYVVPWASALLALLLYRRSTCFGLLVTPLLICPAALLTDYMSNPLEIWLGRVLTVVGGAALLSVVLWFRGADLQEVAVPEDDPGQDAEQQQTPQ